MGVLCTHLEPPKSHIGQQMCFLIYHFYYMFTLLIPLRGSLLHAQPLAPLNGKNKKTSYQLEQCGVSRSVESACAMSILGNLPLRLSHTLEIYLLDLS